jgi:hypothetical protein
MCVLGAILILITENKKKIPLESSRTGLSTREYCQKRIFKNGHL